MKRKKIPRYKRARKLRAKGYSYAKIAKIMRISSGSTWRYVNLPQTVGEERHRGTYRKVRRKR